ncbi:HNH endonuclease [Priestia aryabhattai]|uniref:HNH endonuclease n=1 Tax=Priestia aryabhattai TaxID=412384 RepID=UPI00366C3013
MAIPKSINKEHIIQAIQKIDREGVPDRRESTRFNLSYENKNYPPKYVISIANIFVNGKEYAPSLFSGGDETNRFLEGLGFRIIENKLVEDSEIYINTWIFQGNPRVFDIDNYVKNHKFIWWSLKQKHFIDKIQLNDEVYLWRSDGGKRGTGGVIAKCKIVSLPLQREDDSGAKDYWYTDDWAYSYLAIKLEVLEVKLEDEFINRLSLLEHPVLKELLILRLRQQTNYLLSKKHAIELQRLWKFKNGSIRNELTANVVSDMGSFLNSEMTETEKEQVIKSRIGHSAFKKALLSIDKKCRLCSVSDERFLIASHIKPWSESSNQERLDVNNGLLLCPNHDSLFDKGYISFDEYGIILISASLGETTKVFLNINETMKITMNESQQKYIHWHRENLFSSKSCLEEEV